MSRKAGKGFKAALSINYSRIQRSNSILALIFHAQGQYTEAKKLFLELVNAQKRLLGEEHPDTLISMGNLASTYRDQGRWKEAEELEVQGMETSARVLGEEHPSTLTSMANLTYTWKSQS
jgi:tetratricopeptide (TPR) repeat protein